MGDETMPIDLVEGAKIAYSFPNNGTEYDRKRLKELGLRVGDVLTVSYTDISQSRTSVFTKEYPRQGFNSVNFSLVVMSNDMPEVIWIGDDEYWTNASCGSEFKYYSKFHVQQLIKEAEQRQREKCAEAFDILDYAKQTDIKFAYNAILNAGGE